MSERRTRWGEYRSYCGTSYGRTRVALYLHSLLVFCVSLKRPEVPLVAKGDWGSLVSILSTEHPEAPASLFAALDNLGSVLDPKNDLHLDVLWTACSTVLEESKELSDSVLQEIAERAANVL